eukprot:jgi/Bigna1/80244/fgenesh1_pg.69_\
MIAYVTFKRDKRHPTTFASPQTICAARVCLYLLIDRSKEHRDQAKNTEIKQRNGIFAVIHGHVQKKEYFLPGRGLAKAVHPLLGLGVGFLTYNNLVTQAARSCEQFRTTLSYINSILFHVNRKRKKNTRERRRPLIEHQRHLPYDAAGDAWAGLHQTNRPYSAKPSPT